MSDPVRWVFEAVNAVSDPARQMRGSLAGLDDVARAAKAGLGGLSSGAHALGGAVGGVFHTIERTARALVHFGRDVYAVFESIAHAEEAKRNALDAFTALTGSTEAGNATLDVVRKMANSFGAPTAKINELYQSFARTGLQAKETQDLIAASADAAAVYGKGAESIDALGKAFLNVRKNNKASLDGFEDVIPLAEIKAQFKGAKDLTDQEFRTWIESGGVKAIEFNDAVMAGIKRLSGGGPLGAKAIESAGESPLAQIQALKNGFNDLIGDVAKMKPVADIFKTLSGALDKDSESGQELRETLGEAATDIGELLKEAFTPENIKEFVDWVKDGAKEFRNFVKEFRNAGDDEESFAAQLKSMIKEVPAVVKGLMRVGRVAAEIGGDVVWVVERVTDVVQFIDKAIDRTSHFFWDLGNTVEEVADNIGTAWGLGVGEVLKFVDDIVGAVEGAVDDMVSAGEDIVDGLWGGIQTGLKTLKSGWNDAIDFLPESVSSKLKIQSPSKVMDEKGRYTVEGFFGGAEREAERSRDSFTDIFAPPELVASTSSAGARAIAGSSIVVYVTMGDTHFAPGTSPGEGGRELAQSIRVELKRALEELR